MKQKFRIRGTLVKDSQPKSYSIPKDSIIIDTIITIPQDTQATKPHTTARVKWEDVPSWEIKK